jgi:SAM-dependent methyltransferase
MLRSSGYRGIVSWRLLSRRIVRAYRITLRIAPYWLRAPLFRWTPGGFGYYRRLRRYAEPGYEWQRDRHPVREKHHGAERLGEPSRGFVTRDYGSYAEYVVHQRQKLDEILRSGAAFPNAAVAAYRRRFYRRFRHLIRYLPPDATIICLGARQGTEVEVLRELGFRNAYGIDLNPGPENELVAQGDFHDIDVPDDSVDLVYSNSLDHAFDLERFFVEHRRVLKDDGFALYDVHGAYSPGDKAAFESTLWTRPEHVLKRILDHFQRVLRLETVGDWTWVLVQRPFPVESPATVVTPGRQRIPRARGSVVARRRHSSAAPKVLLVAALMASLLMFLPEALGDWPYNVFGPGSERPHHHVVGTHRPA